MNGAKQKQSEKRPRPNQTEQNRTDIRNESGDWTEGRGFGISEFVHYAFSFNGKSLGSRPSASRPPQSISGRIRRRGQHGQLAVTGGAPIVQTLHILLSLSQIMSRIISRTAGLPVFSLGRSAYPKAFIQKKRFCTARSSLEPPDVARLAETARISLTPQQVEEFGPKIRQVVDWFGQLQTVDLESIEPALRAGAPISYFLSSGHMSYDVRTNINSSNSEIPFYMLHFFQSKGREGILVYNGKYCFGFKINATNEVVSLKENTETDNFREDEPETFENRDAVIAAVPTYDDPYIKVPKVLNKES
ncbi:aspartyl/glutamyl-tRNA(Asn/Gln) amidotransferasesubunit C [Striga asiatica]|uniref:Aspartyl/glutamyl-tRNA(Asn/Gln) amidotransferasesubunit C n=1 Tax=Striga asiatica TaxID=4170 RepID=A0A5A7PHH8_STRAF|nr:aspartyl/glutamyl-tRNA(Asn/Gln) amidotransferasesubunit C [Striga asiatica]